jgi:hypothetical protein
MRHDEKSVCVVMGDDRPIAVGEAARRSYCSLAYEINRRFCEEKGWDFRYEQYRLPARPWGKLSAYCTAARQHRGASWVKILAILRALDLGYQLVIWVDSDCIFHRHDADWTDFLGLFDRRELQLAGWPDRPFHDDQVCCGFFAVRNSPQVREMLTEIWTQPSKSHSSHPYEQDAFVHYLRGKPSNWHHLVDEAMFHLEKPDQRILHLASFSHHLRIPEFSRWFSQRGISPHPQLTQHHVHLDLDVDAADALISGRVPNASERARRELHALRMAGVGQYVRLKRQLMSSRIGPEIRQAVDGLRRDGPSSR